MIGPDPIRWVALFIREALQTMTKRSHPTTRPFRMGSTRRSPSSAPGSPAKRQETGPLSRGRVVRFLGRGGLILSLLGLAISVALVLPWRWMAPPTTAFMLSDRLAGTHRIHHRWVSWEEISPHLPIAVVAAEDQKFPRHRGFDFDAILQATRERRKKMRGASTISQQVDKNLYLWPGRSLVRKGLEAWFTVLIESLWPKRRILEIYLNVAEFGPGIYGVGAASEAFFRRSPSKVSRRQAALMAAVLPSPRRMSAARPSAYVDRRAREITAWVRKLGGPGYLSDL